MIEIRKPDARENTYLLFWILTLQSAGSERNQLQMPGLHPAAARMWERIQ